MLLGTAMGMVADGSNACVVGRCDTADSLMLLLLIGLFLTPSLSACGAATVRVFVKVPMGAHSRKSGKCLNFVYAKLLNATLASVGC